MSGGCMSDEMNGGSCGQTQWFRFIDNHKEQNNMTWACAVADVKKKALYEKFKPALKENVLKRRWWSLS